MSAAPAVVRSTDQRRPSRTGRLPSVDVFERQGPYLSRRHGGEDSSDGESDEEADGAEASGSQRRQAEHHGNDHADDLADEDEDGFDEYDAHSSAFTNPSWYGSPSTRRDGLAWGASSSLATSPKSPALSSSMRKLSISGASPPIGSGGAIVPRQVATYHEALRKIRALSLESDKQREQQKDVQHDAALASRLDEDLPPPPVSSLGSGFMRRWMQASPPAAGPGAAHRARPPSGAALHRYGPTDAATFDDVPTYLCATCGTTLALQDELISKAFSGRDGKAYLFFSVMNARAGAKEDRHLITGLHTVADLTCACCDRAVGWTYLRAYEASQRYKEGKYILERASLHKANHW